MDDDAANLDVPPKTPTLIGKQFSRKDVVAGLGATFKNLAKAVANGALLVPTGGGTIGNVIDNVLEIPSAFASG